jgi:pimeloyl-ACP methyl ester carboxylesterase
MVKKVMLNTEPFLHGNLVIVPEPLTESAGPLRVVVLHGWGNSRENIRPLATQLAALGEVWVVDLPGHGTSPAPAITTTPAMMAEAVNAWLATLPPCPTVVVGHSMGFRVAAHMAALQPKAFKGLVAVAGAGVPRPLTFKKRLRKVGIRLAIGMAKRFKSVLGDGVLTALRKKYGSRDYNAANPAMKPTFLAVVNDDITPLCSGLSMPVLLIYGSDDTETPPALGETLHKLLAASKFVVLPHHTHASVLEGGRHLVAREILTFTLPFVV